MEINGTRGKVYITWLTKKPQMKNHGLFYKKEQTEYFKEVHQILQGVLL